MSDGEGAASAPGDRVRRVVLDRTRPLQEALDCGHTRWHPDVSPIARIVPGEVVLMDARDGGDVQIGRDTTETNAAGYDLDRLHPLTGPFYVAGVEPGDLLEVEILDVTAADFGWSRVTSGGAGLMSDSVHDSLLVKWTLEDGVAHSAELPGVAIRGAPFVGTIGVAPSAGRLAAIARRERTLVDEGGWALLPSPKHAVPRDPEIEVAGLRTMPPREFGGNMDVKDIAPGCRVTFTANVAGALLSLGDLHFAQGDGESFGTAIEMSGSVRFRCGVRKASELRWRPRSPFLETPAGSPARDGRRYLITTGVSVDEQDRNGYMDLKLAARNALNEMADYLTEERGYSRPQAHCIVSVAGDLRINVVNNPPNPVVSVALPLDIFEEVS
jgi:formamidase